LQVTLVGHSHLHSHTTYTLVTVVVGLHLPYTRLFRHLTVPTTFHLYHYTTHVTMGIHTTFWYVVLLIVDYTHDFFVATLRYLHLVTLRWMIASCTRYLRLRYALRSRFHIYFTLCGCTTCTLVSYVVPERHSPYVPTLDDSIPAVPGFVRCAVRAFVGRTLTTPTLPTDLPPHYVAVTVACHITHYLARYLVILPPRTRLCDTLHGLPDVVTGFWTRFTVLRAFRLLLHTFTTHRTSDVGSFPRTATPLCSSYLYAFTAGHCYPRITCGLDPHGPLPSHTCRTLPRGFLRVLLVPDTFTCTPRTYCLPTYVLLILFYHTRFLPQALPLSALSFPHTTTPYRHHNSLRLLPLRLTDVPTRCGLILRLHFVVVDSSDTVQFTHALHLGCAFTGPRRYTLLPSPISTRLPRFRLRCYEEEAALDVYIFV